MTLDIRILKNEGDYLRLMVEGQLFEIKGIIAKSFNTLHALGWALLYGKSADVVCLLGESGTGKEVFFKAICNTNNQKKTLNVNCGALSESLLESELFGHKKGSFTDASSDRQGAFMEASGGTLFLDEIGEMSIKGQAKLLRAIEYNEIKPIGYDTVFHHDARIILATNRNLQNLVKEEKFRKDLYYRIESFSVQIPPLRERKEDLIFLAKHFAGDNYKISNTTANAILDYEWPGNVRELKNAIERAKIKSMFGEKEITWEMMGVNRFTNVYGINYKRATVFDYEKDLICEALGKCDNSITDTSKMLGIPRSTLYRKLKKFELRA